MNPLESTLFCGATGDCIGSRAGTPCLGKVCVNGTCEEECPGTLVRCSNPAGGTVCVNTAQSDLFCGATGDCTGPNAGVVCANGTGCVGGMCVSDVCETGFVRVGGACVPEDTTPDAIDVSLPDGGLAPGSSVAGTVTVNGVNTDVPVSISGGSCVFDSTGTATATASNGAVLAITCTPPGAGQTITVTVTAGGVTGSDTITGAATDGFDCADIRARNPAAASGDRVIDPDGNGPILPVNVRCDVTDPQVTFTCFTTDDFARHPGVVGAGTSTAANCQVSTTFSASGILAGTDDTCTAAQNAWVATIDLPFAPGYRYFRVPGFRSVDGTSTNGFEFRDTSGTAFNATAVAWNTPPDGSHDGSGDVGFGNPAAAGPLLSYISAGANGGVFVGNGSGATFPFPAAAATVTRDLGTSAVAFRLTAAQRGGGGGENIRLWSAGEICLGRTLDVTPDDFDLTFPGGPFVPGSTVTSDSLTLAGIETAVPVSVDNGCAVQVGGSPVTTVGPGQAFTVVCTAPAVDTVITVTAGGVDGTGTITIADGTTCQDIRDRNPSAATGTYVIDPDGAGGAAPFSVTCDFGIQPGTAFTCVGRDTALASFAPTFSVTGAICAVSQLANGQIRMGQFVTTCGGTANPWTATVSFAVPFSWQQVLFRNFAIRDNGLSTENGFDMAPSGSLFGVAWATPQNNSTNGDFAMGSRDRPTPVTSFVQAGNRSGVPEAPNATHVFLGNGTVFDVGGAVRDLSFKAGDTTGAAGGEGVFAWTAGQICLGEPLDTTPDGFSLTFPGGPFAPGSTVTSNPATLAGINSATSISANQGCSIRVGGNTVTSVSPGQAFTVVCTAPGFGSDVTVTVAAGGVNGTGTYDLAAHCGEVAGTTVFTDCLDALGGGVTTNGEQCVDPDGAGSSTPFQVYCDQTTAGGGWTLIAKVPNNSSATLGGLDSARWLSRNYFGDTSRLDQNPGLGAAYERVPFADVMIRDVTNGAAHLAWRHATQFPSVHSVVSQVQTRTETTNRISGAVESLGHRQGCEGFNTRASNDVVYGFNLDDRHSLSGGLVPHNFLGQSRSVFSSVVAGWGRPSASAIEYCANNPNLNLRNIGGGVGFTSSEPSNSASRHRCASANACTNANRSDIVTYTNAQALFVRRRPDTTPNAFSLSFPGGPFAPGSTVTSDPVTLTGIDATTSISANQGCSVRIGGNTVTSVSPTQTFTVVCTAPGFGNDVAVTVAAGGVNGTGTYDLAAHCGEVAGTTVFTDCSDALARGVTSNGVQCIDPDGAAGNTPFRVLCDQTRDGGGWTLMTTALGGTLSAPSLECTTPNAACSVAGKLEPVTGWAQMRMTWDACPIGRAFITTAQYTDDSGACLNAADSLTQSPMINGRVMKLWDDCGLVSGGQRVWFGPAQPGGNGVGMVSGHFTPTTTDLVRTAGAANIGKFECRANGNASTASDDFASVWIRRAGG